MFNSYKENRGKQGIKTVCIVIVFMYSIYVCSRIPSIAYHICRYVRKLYIRTVCLPTLFEFRLRLFYKLSCYQVIK
uniref:Uncharacterized protein n=1 Tax=Lepeophtheirus salmonis TaxID=72036 RepID=A0A0K2URC0_LEPSM